MENRNESRHNVPLFIINVIFQWNIKEIHPPFQYVVPSLKKSKKQRFHTSSICMPPKKQKLVPSPGLLVKVLEKQRTNLWRWVLKHAVTSESVDKTSWEVGGQWVMSPVTSFILLKILSGRRCQNNIPVSSSHWAAVKLKKKKKSFSVGKSVKFLSHPLVWWIQIADNSFPDESGTVGNQISVLIKSFIKADHLITCCLMTSLLYISRY